MLKLFRAAGIECADDMLAGIATVLSRYPVEVIDHVTSPDGLYSTCKWFPTGQEITKACDAEMAPILRQQERDRLGRQADEVLRGDALPRTERLSYDELVGKYGRDWGIGKKPSLVEEAYLARMAKGSREPFRVPSDDDLRQRYGTRSPEQLAEDERRRRDFEAAQKAAQKTKRDDAA